MEFRIGINLGDVIEEEDRIYGDGVNIAARLEALADPGGICISKTAFDHIESKLPFGYSFIGEQTVKNIAKPIGAYKVLMETRVVDAKTKQKNKGISYWRKKSVLSVGIIVIMAIATGLYWNFYLNAPSMESTSKEKLPFPLREKPSIAVLPFDNIGGDPEQENFSDGLAENIITQLSQIHNLIVKYPNSSSAYKGEPVNIKQTAEELGARYILEGSVQRVEKRFRVNIKLIDAFTGTHLWANQYNRELTDRYTLQDEITRSIITEMAVELVEGENERLWQKQTQNVEAWTLYRRALKQLRQFEKETIFKARELLETAIRLEPKYSEAHSLLGWTYALPVSMGFSKSPKEDLKRAEDLVNQAKELDRNNSDAQNLLGNIYALRGQFDRAILEGQRAVDLSPNTADTYAILSISFGLGGQPDEAIAAMLKAMRLAPSYPKWFLYNLAQYYFTAGRYEDAESAFKHYLKQDPQAFIQHPWLAVTYSILGRDEEAKTHVEQALKIRPTFCTVEWSKEFTSWKNRDEVQQILDIAQKIGIPERPPNIQELKETPKTIVVLPFADISPEKDQEAFVDGLSEEIRNSLDQIPGLNVIGRTSSVVFKESSKTAQEIGKILKTSHTLEGSVRKVANNIRITTQLVNVSDNVQLWSEKYDRELIDIFDIQEDIATKVAEKLKLTLESLSLLGGTKDIDAYELYLKAKGKRSEVDPAGYERALSLLNEAIEIDPEFALAWSYKANIHHLLAVFGPLNRRVDHADEGLKAAKKAIDLQPNLADAYIYLGVNNVMKYEWDKADHNYQKALGLIGESLSFENHLIIPFYLNAGKFGKVYKLLEKMRKNDPTHQAFLAWYYYAYSFLDDRERAEDIYQNRNLSILKDYSNWHDDAITEVRLGSGDKISNNEIVSSNPIHILGKKYIASPEEGLKEIHQIYSNPVELSAEEIGFIALWAAYFGDYDFALDVIEQHVEVMQLWFPIMKEIRKTPRFKKIARETGMVDYWKEYGWPDLCHPVGDDDFVCD